METGVNTGDGAVIETEIDYSNTDEDVETNEEAVSGNEPIPERDSLPGFIPSMNDNLFENVNGLLEIESGLPTCMPHPQNCGFNYSAPYTGHPRQLHCRINYEMPHQIGKEVETVSVEYYSNCGVCMDSSRAVDANIEFTSVESPVSVVSQKKCFANQGNGNEQMSIRYSFWVETLSDSSCEYDTHYFTYNSQLRGTLLSNGETDACFPF